MPAVRITIPLWVALCLCAPVQAFSAGRVFSAAEYIAELDHVSTLASQVHQKPSAADEAIDELRGGWKVEAEGREFKIDTGWIVDRFEKLKTDSGGDVRDELVQRLNGLKYDAQKFQQSPLDSTHARATLTQILSRSEFHQVQGPTWFDRLKYRVLMWLFRLLSRLFGASSAPTVGRILVWTLVTVAVIVTAFFVYKAIRQSARLESVVPQIVPVSAKSWRVWMEEAQGAAAKGLWREAVHLVYWAGISFLEQGGMWKPDKARTPREYLRLLPEGSERRGPLSNLTRKLELTWYGNHPAGPETFSETVTLLEDLGCPAGISTGDRKVLLITGAAFLILVVLGFLLAPSNTEIHDPSSYSTASEGAKAAYLLLQESGYRVERWQRPANDLKPGGQTVLVIADPATFPDAKEKKAVERFISSGGRVITNGIVGAAFLPEDFSELNPMPTKPWNEFTAATPSAITRAAPKITLSAVSFWKDRSGISLYGSDEGTVVARLLHGNGDAIWLASATPLTNAGLKEPGSLEFLLAAIGDKQQVRVLFDEYVHGYGEQGAPEKRHPLMTALFLQSLVLAAAALFTFSRRSGPLRPMPAESRLSPLEFVETLGGLYQQAHAAAVAVDVYYQRFQFWITRRLGLSKDASAEEIDRAVRERWRWDDDKFLQTLRGAASARYHPGLPQWQALEIVQSLHSYAVKLKLFPAAKEKS